MPSKIEKMKLSLQKKKDLFDRKLSEHYEDARSTNGQPLNDKRNGVATQKRWERQNNTLMNLNASIEKTEVAIDKYECQHSYAEVVLGKMPAPVKKLVEEKKIVQWIKHPTTFFVAGVKTGRFVWDFKKNFMFARYIHQIETKEEYAVFRDIYNGLRKALLQSTPD